MLKLKGDIFPIILKNFQDTLSKFANIKNISSVLTQKEKFTSFRLKVNFLKILYHN